MKHIYNIIIFIIIVIAILSITGCTTIEKKQAIIKPDELISRELFENQLSDLMHDYASLEKKNNTELEAIFNNVKEKFENDNNNINRIRYILLLTLPSQKFYDTNIALSLLKNWPETERQPSSFESFRNLLIMRLEEELRLKRMAKQLFHQLANEKLKSEMLQKKIEDIKDMEKSLIRRNMP
ncbi:hypothetical protein SAMN05216302_10754 [Nitrosomonas aestuarii]|uniref:Uncharacterized protein n=1 Tax=Nitrosomonas aestuarii TaxID=52441 RepID=A0A1I4HB10_9PROT|nr:hypothetical protein [Nitrosomonas aestuarii]SFL38863.1 hypothetical protein SAMN05216302_10754 [Nitrosomonas aestuarii]